MSRRINVTVLGAGSWGTTVASIASRNADTIVWARRAETADEINREHLTTGTRCEAERAYLCA